MDEDLKNQMKEELGLEGEEVTEEQIFGKFLEQLFSRQTIDEAIKEKEEDDRRAKEIFNSLDNIYKGVLRDRIEFIGMVNSLKIRLLSAKIAAIVLNAGERDIIDKMIELANNTKDTLVNEKELLNTVGVNIERLRKHEMIDFCIEIRALLICMHNRYVCIMDDMHEKLQAYSFSLNGITYSSPSGNQERFEETNQKIDELRKILGI